MKMTIDEAIRHCEEVAESKSDEAKEAYLQEQDKYADECTECAAEHKQLADWLKELKELREKVNRSEKPNSSDSITNRRNLDLRENKTISLSPTNFATLAICSIRYCHGRQTYMPSLVQGIVREHLTELDDRDLSVMLNDCEGMREFDYGDPMIDRPHWEQWRADLLKEKERRENG